MSPMNLGSAILTKLLDLNMNTESRNKALSQIASALSQKLSQPTEFRYCMLAMQSTNILLRKEVRRAR